MIEVYPNLFVGNQLAYESQVRLIDSPKQGWCVVHCCKEPYHRHALGYTGRGAPKDHAEYLFAFRGTRLCLNLVDVDNADYSNKTLIDAALKFIGDSLAEGNKVLVHCNQGQSRGPSVALLYLGIADQRYAGLNAADAMLAFQEVYPLFSPANGFSDYLIRNWPHKQAA